ncbi:hypothetical protein [Comamonas antarctica]|uniref:hypothetical protein n=1 Tax=Comamonas antarctica TaxID=2743470 RepID=UPI0028EF923E|nr:hypothetical protein [Comamonas antarctica]
MRIAILTTALLLAGCNEATYQQVQFSNCVYGKTSPEYAEAVRACADAAIRLRESAQSQKGKP